MSQRNQLVALKIDQGGYGVSLVFRQSGQKTVPDRLDSCCGTKKSMLF
jgi:hypothetical protein